MNANTTTNPFTIDTIITAGTGEDMDTGRVVAIDGDDVTVAWEGAMVQTTQPWQSLVDDSDDTDTLHCGCGEVTGEYCD